MKRTNLQTIKSWPLQAFTLLAIPLTWLLVPQVAFASDAANSRGNACAGLGIFGGASCGGSGQPDASGLNGLIGEVVGVLSWILGIIAVIMIVVAGLKYITSGGDSNKTASAKNTLVGAILAILAVAIIQFLISFVFGVSTNTFKL